MPVVVEDKAPAMGVDASVSRRPVALSLEVMLGSGVLFGHALLWKAELELAGQDVVGLDEMLEALRSRGCGVAKEKEWVKKKAVLTL